MSVIEFSDKILLYKYIILIFIYLEFDIKNIRILYSHFEDIIIYYISITFSKSFLNQKQFNFLIQVLIIIKSRKDSSRLTINDDLFDQETVRLKSIWEELNPVDDIVDNDLFDLIDNIDSLNTVFDKFDEEDLLQDQSFIKEAFDALPAIAQNILKQNHDNLFISSKNYQEQIYTTLDLIYSDSIKCPLSSIGKLFGIQKGAIAKHLKRKSQLKLNHGRPNTLTEEQFRIVLQYIKDSYEANDYLEIDEIADFICTSFDISIQYGTLYRLIMHSKFTKIVDASIMDSVRAEVPLETIQTHYTKLRAVLEANLLPPDFIFNIDECGFIDFIDMKKRHVVVPEYATKNLVLSVNRSTKRVTMLWGIALDGTKLRPLLILPNKRIDKDLLQNGYGERNPLYCYQENGFINSTIFDFWAKSIFLPEIQRRREETGYTGLILLLLDGCSSHFSDFFLDEATYHGIYIFQEHPWSGDFWNSEAL